MPRFMEDDRVGVDATASPGVGGPLEVLAVHAHVGLDDAIAPVPAGTGAANGTIAEVPSALYPAHQRAPVSRARDSADAALVYGLQARAAHPCPVVETALKLGVGAPAKISRFDCEPVGRGRTPPRARWRNAIERRSWRCAPGPPHEPEDRPGRRRSSLRRHGVLRAEAWPFFGRVLDGARASSATTPSTAATKVSHAITC